MGMKPRRPSRAMFVSVLSKHPYTYSLLTIQTTITMFDPLETSSTVDTEQPIASPSHNLPSGMCDRGGSPAMGSGRTRNSISGLFRRRHMQASVERDAASDM
jgi:hypothetical protein